MPFNKNVQFLSRF